MDLYGKHVDPRVVWDWCWGALPTDAPWVIADPAHLCVSSLGMANTKLIYINQAKTSLANAERDMPIVLLPMSLFACACFCLPERPWCQVKQRKQLEEI